MKPLQPIPVNFIRHIDVFLEIVNTVDSINYSHVALYLSLFRMWNLSFFVNPFSPSRDEIMSYAGIKSKESFYRILRELNAYDLIRYYPSKSKFERSLFCLSGLEYNTDSIKISVWGITNHETLPNKQQQISFPVSPSANIVDIKTKAKLFNGRGSLVLEKTVFLKDGISGNESHHHQNQCFDPLTDPRYASQIDNRISSLSNNSNYANHQNSQSGRTGLRPPGVQIDPDADYSVPL
ncbi:MAG: hypothetical protein IPI53_15490 [Saprospiraceae bacterium]|nr:hypothetical protein [Saprospiraceae bacterium]